MFLIRNVLTTPECDAFVERSEQSGYEDATMYNETFWNLRYAGSDYVYGTEPNWVASCSS